MQQELIALLGADKVSVATDDLATHAIDKWNFAASPEVVVFAESTDDVSKVLVFAHQNKIPVTTRGAGIGYVGGAVPIQGGIVLSVARMNQILELAPADGLAVVQPGVITKTLQDAADEVGWYYPPDPASLKECSLGGNIATNAGGPRCLKYGVTKNYVMGLEVVLADGTITRVGGRCHKNKTGFSLTELFVGSEGLLGIVTEATLRIIPHPQRRAMLTATFAPFSEAAAAVQTILNSGHLPSALEITDAFTLQAARDYLGADSLPAGEAHLIVEIDGRNSAVEAELPELESLLSTAGALSIETHRDDAACEAVWKLRREFSYSLRATGLTKLNEDIVVPRSKLVELVEYAQKLAANTGIPVACFGHAGDGNIHVNLMVEDYDDPEKKKPADAALDQLFNWILANRGAITGEHGVGLAKKRWFQQAVGEANFSVHQAIKNALDEDAVLNPGKFLG
ncbi:FAD-binding oxidoreductase [Roseibacillus persicicus]|uniref:FAD-binding oxidoreductase n=1 Tax=Roseibacillus persicicus TaxID=454148 RepID=UPI00280D14EC|nr:FAD-linked oxidase C-terminal domain-containing protein [Roseibacillus persicicus]MDQ8192331.1 FAD-linked oxidase C-terminal domain-containing protein [Roseibacillus persicicus]